MNILYISLQNLDVNLAVNNLLSRDDEDGEDGEDSQDAYMPGKCYMSSTILLLICAPSGRCIHLLVLT